MSKQYTVRCKELLPSGNGLVIFNNSKFEVAGVLPGEKCTIELVYKKEGTGARLVEILEPSKDRVAVKCPVYDKCGGCNLQHMSYEAELKFKSDKVKKLYQDLNVTQLPIIKNENFEHYRNKIYASFSFEKRGRGEIRQIAGMYEENTRKVVNCSDCLIQNSVANSIIKTILDLMRLTGTRSYDPDTKTGVLRHAYIRVAEKTGKVMLVLVTGVPEFKDKSRFVQTLIKKHPCIETIVHNINPGKTGMILGNKENVIYGKGYIMDELCGCTFKISPKSFYQVNPRQTAKLYEAAVVLGDISSTDTVIDAYSGIGTISLIAAKKAGKVIGVEINPDAVRDAKENAEINSITNVEFLKGDAGEFLEKEAKTLNPDVIFMDPPRSGSDEKFLKAVCTAAPDRIVYISCNPETQVRDVKYLIENGYALKVIRPVDMFSRTGHVETVVLLTRVN
jgi:23S rRNA (uracil1939-C5)-methyltransferase